MDVLCYVIDDVFFIFGVNCLCVFLLFMLNVYYIEVIEVGFCGDVVVFG